ncbi:MAG: hypothetical protein M3071_19015 [Actinomycetota bacterium]|nr:hypothetical protein [Actinomycetota bacterium]
MKKQSIALLVPIVLVLVLVTGGAVAATTYIITSTRQIKPSVLAQLGGARGTPGPAGAFSAANVVDVTGAPQQLCVAMGSVSTICRETVGTAQCPVGAVVISGGWSGGNDPPFDASVADNHPTNNGTAWQIGMFDVSGGGMFIPYAVCAKQSGVPSRRARRVDPGSMGSGAARPG